MRLSYRTRRALQQAGIVFLILFLLFIVAWFCSVVFLERHVVYTREGAMLDMEVSANDLVGELAKPPSRNTNITIYYNEGADALGNANEMTQLDGYFIDIDDLQNDIAGVWDLLDPLAAGTPIMIDLKGGYGSFFYTTTLPGTITSAAVSTASVDEMIGDMNQKGFYTIARISALRDYNYGLNHVSSGLMHVNRLGLWPDEGHCYWLDPLNAGTQEWLVSIIKELKNMGFREVVLTDFKFPNSDMYIYNGDKDAALATAAQALLDECGADDFVLSFQVASSTFALPNGRTRMYLEGISANNIGAVVANAKLDVPENRLVFITETSDTRFSAYGALRPITASTILESQKAAKASE